VGPGADQTGGNRSRSCRSVPGVSRGTWTCTRAGLRANAAGGSHPCAARGPPGCRCGRAGTCSASAASSIIAVSRHASQSDGASLSSRRAVAGRSSRRPRMLRRSRYASTACIKRPTGCCVQIRRNVSDAECGLPPALAGGLPLRRLSRDRLREEASPLFRFPPNRGSVVRSDRSARSSTRLLGGPPSLYAGAEAATARRKHSHSRAGCMRSVRS
jgi:hypothetical protein